MLVTFVQADAYDDLRLKWRDITVGAGYDTNDAAVISRLNSVANAANSVWSSMDKSPSRTFLWSDAASATKSSHITTSYTRLRSMALAHATSGCSLQGNATLLADIIGGLEWLNTNRYNETIAQYDNWWDWEIGTPLRLTDICVLIYSQLSSTQRTNYMNAVNHQVPTPDMTGANKVWKARVVGVRGCLVKSSAKLALCRDAFSDVFPYVTTGDGFYVDGSFVQHNIHPYTAGYGAALIDNMAPVLNWLSGSTWKATDPAQANLYRWVFDSYEPIIYRGNTFDLVRGREAGRANASTSSYGMMESILEIAQFAPAADAARMKSMIKGWALSDTTRDFVAGRGLSTLQMAQELMADTSIVPRPELLAHYTFADMDRVIHLGTGYGFGLSMCSSRIANFESINGENLRGWFTGDGQTILHNADLNAFADAYGATIDPYRLPGVTADVTHNKLPPDPASIGPRAQGQSTLSPYGWVGGATLGKFGAAGMWFKGVGVTLTGRKSWFMFDDEVVCLGTGITSTDNRPIETTVENRKLNTKGSNAFTVNGTVKSNSPGWTETMNSVTSAHLAGTASGADIGYYFPQPATIKAVREARTGSWSDIDSDGSTDPITRNYFRMGFEHGSNPSNATYQYVLLPGRNATSVASYAAQPQITVIANNANVQAVSEITLGITAANFWSDTVRTAGVITSDKKSCVLIQNDGTFLDVAVSDPTQVNPGSINLQIAMNGGVLVNADGGVSVTQTSPTVMLSVDVNGSAGRTFHARFYLGSPAITDISAKADSYVYDAAGSENSNYGTSSTLAVKKANTGYNRESYLRFNVPAYRGALIGAYLQLMPLSTSTPGVHGIARVEDDSWIESGAGGITWNNRPSSTGGTLATWTPAVGVPIEANVTNAIPASGQVSFRVYGTTQTSDGLVSYGSREHSTAANKPKLTLFTGPVPPVVAIENPTDGDFFPQADTITITASAQAPEGTITGVAFYDGATLLGTDTTPPYSINADLAGGFHDLSAMATASNGLSKTSLTRRIEIAFPPTALAGNASTPLNTSVDVDLSLLVSDVETPLSKLRFNLGSASNGSVMLLPDGHTARFTPTPGYSGPANFGYSVSDTATDARTLFNYDFQASDSRDITGNGRDGALNVQGTGAAGFTGNVPQALAPQHTLSLQLTENGTAGAARVERALTIGDVDLANEDWTITGWFKRSVANNLDVVMQLGASGGYSSDAMTLAFYSSSSTLELRNYNGAALDAGLSKTGVTTGVWHHFAVVRGASKLNWYHNGVLVGTDSAFGFSFDNSSPVKFGGPSATSVLDRWLNGSLADLAVFNAALSGTEIGELITRPVAHLAGQTTASTVNVNVLFPFDSWRLLHFGTTANTGSYADTADKDNDGLSNLLEYACGTNPNTNNAQPHSSALSGGSNLEYIYTRDKAATDVVFAVEWSDTLTGPWNTSGVTSTIMSDNGTTQQIKATLSAGTNGGRFVRLRVTH